MAVFHHERMDIQSFKWIPVEYSFIRIWKFNYLMDVCSALYIYFSLYFSAFLCRFIRLMVLSWTLDNFLTPTLALAPGVWLPIAIGVFGLAPGILRPWEWSCCVFACSSHFNAICFAAILVVGDLPLGVLTSMFVLALLLGASLTTWFLHLWSRLTVRSSATGLPTDINEVQMWCDYIHSRCIQKLMHHAPNPSKI